MNKFKYLFFTLLLFFIFFINVDADTCDSNDIKRLKEITKNVNVSYTLDDRVGEDEYQTYNKFYLEISGITNEIYFYFDNTKNNNIYDDEDELIIYDYSKTDNGTIVLDGYSSGNYEIVIASSECGDILRNVKIKIPTFNKYSLDDRCKEDKYSYLDICDPWYDKAIYIDPIDLDKYFGESNKTLLSNLLYILKQYYYFTIIGVIMLILIIVLLFKLHKKRWSLG